MRGKHVGSFLAMICFFHRDTQSRHLLIPHLPVHLANLTASIRRRALIQYFQPFESVKLSRMATAFGLEESVVLQEVLELVGSGEIDGRIDLPNMVSGS